MQVLILQLQICLEKHLAFEAMEGNAYYCMKLCRNPSISSAFVHVWGLWDCVVARKNSLRQLSISQMIRIRKLSSGSTTASLLPDLRGACPLQIQGYVQPVPCKSKLTSVGMRKESLLLKAGFPMQA